MFDAPVEDCQVDCRDLLCTVFQGWDRSGTRSSSDVLSDLRKIYGESIVRYFEAAAATSEQDVRVGLCDAAMYDREVVLGHYSSNVCWQGRHGVRCRSAFSVRSPVPPTRIVGVRRAGGIEIPRPTITLDDLLGQGRPAGGAKRPDIVPNWLDVFHDTKREAELREAKRAGEQG